MNFILYVAMAQNIIYIYIYIYNSSFLFLYTCYPEPEEVHCFVIVEETVSSLAVSWAALRGNIDIYKVSIANNIYMYLLYFSSMFIYIIITVYAL